MTTWRGTGYGVDMASEKEQAQKPKWREREWWLTILLTIGIFVDAYFDLGIDFEHWVLMLGADGAFVVSRGLAKSKAKEVGPVLERIAEVTKRIAQLEDAKPEGGVA